MIKTVALLYIMTITVPVWAQPDPGEALHLLNTAQFDKAFTLYSKLVDFYPKDPGYNYYAGRCLYELRDNPEKCREYLYTSVTGDGPKDAFLYYAKINYHTYHLKEAQESLEQFSRKLNFIEKMKYDIKRLEKSIENAMSLVKRYTVTDTEIIDTLQINEVQDKYNQYNTGYQLVLPTKKDYMNYGINDPGESLVIIPAKDGYRKFITGQAGLRNKGNELYEVTYHEDFKGIQAKMLGYRVNSTNDEKWAWWDGVNEYLYFSSNGHENLGGYDIFRSRWNSENSTWEKPENLGFPVNSTYDDFILPAAERDGFYLLTNRYIQKDQFAVFKVKILSTRPVDTPSLLPEYLMALSKLGHDGGTGKSRSSAESTIGPDKQHLSNAVEERYNRIINEALRLQVKADSLMRLAKQHEQGLIELNDRFQREQVFKKIKQLKEKGRSVQIQADGKFKMARYIEENEFKGTGKHKNSITDTDRKQPADIIQEKLTISIDNKASEGKDHTVIHEFEIRTYSPYHDDNPIPFDYQLPDGLLYRIQLGVFSKPVPENNFDGITPVTGEIIPPNGYKKYYAGLFSRATDAEQALMELRSLGYNDAYIVAWFNGNRISVNRAENIEKTIY